MATLVPTEYKGIPIPPSAELWTTTSHGGDEAIPIPPRQIEQMEDDERDEQERPRPRIVDKRVTARPSDGASRGTDAVDAAEPKPSEVPPGATSEIPSKPAPPESVPPPEQETVWTPQQEEEARRMVEEIRRVPSTDWVMSSLMTLVNVASVKLESGDAEGAQLAIDALSGIMDSVGSRLGDSEAPLRQVVTQLKMAFAQTMMPGTPGAPEPGS